MKLILGHKSYDQGEIVGILERTGTYTCPTLPHYRYGRVKSICHTLKRLSLITVSDRNPVSVNFVVTDRFRKWKAEKAAGLTKLGVVKWSKQKETEDAT